MTRKHEKQRRSCYLSGGGLRRAEAGDSGTHQVAAPAAAGRGPRGQHRQEAGGAIAQEGGSASRRPAAAYANADGDGDGTPRGCERGGLERGPRRRARRRAARQLGPEKGVNQPRGGESGARGYHIHIVHQASDLTGGNPRYHIPAAAPGSRVVGPFEASTATQNRNKARGRVDKAHHLRRLRCNTTVTLPLRHARVGEGLLTCRCATVTLQLQCVSMDEEHMRRRSITITVPLHGDGTKEDRPKRRYMAGTRPLHYARRAAAWGA